jgi:S1-C subfamily serine protease
MSDTTTFFVQFSGLNESRAVLACEGFVGGAATGITVWGAGNSDMNAKFSIPVDDVDALIAELEGDDRVTGYRRY